MDIGGDGRCKASNEPYGTTAYRDPRQLRVDDPTVALQLPIFIDCGRGQHDAGPAHVDNV